MTHHAHEGSAHEPSVEELEADIRRNRQQLGETVEALSAKLDVKSQLKSSTDQAKTRAIDAVSAHWQEIAIGLAYAAVVTVILKRFP